MMNEKLWKIEVEAAFRRGCDHATHTALSLVNELCPDENFEAKQVLDLLHREFHAMRKNTKKDFPDYTNKARARVTAQLPKTTPN